MIAKTRQFVVLLGLIVSVVVLSEATDEGWLGMVPQSARVQVNPIRKSASAVHQGQKIFRTHCAQCHGENAEGSTRAPTLVSSRVQQVATEGDLHWLLVNGNRERGMPSWSKLGDTQIWQVIRYVRSLR